MAEKFFIDILNIDDYVSRNQLQEVTSSTLFNRNSSEPHVDGLLSYRIFGLPGEPARKLLYGYINLNDKFVHPHVYKLLTTLKREIYRDIINGVGSFTVDNGELKRVIASDGDMKIKTGAKVGTGTNFLYEIWDKLDFSVTPETAQQTKEVRETLGILKKDEIFVTKWLVIPAFYRDVDLNTNKRNEYNTFYIRLLELASLIKASTTMFSLFSTTDAHKRIQQTLNDIYALFVLNTVGGSKGFIQNNVIGKTTEYSARLVLSGADFNSNNPNEAETSFTHSALPLSVTIKIFLPFVAYSLRQWFRNYFSGSDFVYYYDSDKSLKRIEVDPTFDDILSIKKLQKRVNLYEESKSHRLEPVTVRGLDKKEYPLMYFAGDELITANHLTRAGFIAEQTPKVLRPMNWTELFYIASYDITKDKFIYITRYPIEDYNSIYPSLFNIIPTKKYKKVTISGIDYPRFPDFGEIANKDYRKVTDSELAFLFSDTLKLFPSYLAQLKADLT